MLLTGHAGEVFTCKFNPAGDVIASGSHDKHMFLWRTYGECENYMMLQGEQQPHSAVCSHLLNRIFFSHNPVALLKHEQHATSC